MAKLNAKVSSERASRTVSKSGNEYLKIDVSNGVGRYFTIWVYAGDGTICLEGGNEYVKNLTPFDIGYN